MRYYHGFDKFLYCRNCKKTGHNTQSCMEETTMEKCTFCATVHTLKSDCKAIQCFKCGKVGHENRECKTESNSIEICFDCNIAGHNEKECLMFEFNYKHFKRNKFIGDLLCLNCGSACGEIECKLVSSFSSLELQSAWDITSSDIEVDSDSSQD